MGSGWDLGVGSNWGASSSGPRPSVRRPGLLWEALLEKCHQVLGEGNVHPQALKAHFYSNPFSLGSGPPVGSRPLTQINHSRELLLFSVPLASNPSCLLVFLCHLRTLPTPTASPQAIPCAHSYNSLSSGIFSTSGNVMSRKMIACFCQRSR